MDVDKMTSIKQFSSELEEELNKKDDSHIKIGFFGGRKFILGDDSNKKYSMDQLIKKANELAKKGETFSQELSNLENNLKKLNQRGDDKLTETSLIKTVIMALRRFFRKNQVKNRFTVLDDRYKILKEEEKQEIIKNKSVVIKIIKKDIVSNEIYLSPHLKAALDCFLILNNIKEINIPDDPTDDQMVDIWERIVRGDNLNFENQVKEFKEFLSKMKLLKIDVGEFDFNILTISGLEAVNNGVKYLSSLGVSDSKNLKLFINHLLEDPNGNYLNWVNNKGVLINPLNLDQMKDI